MKAGSTEEFNIKSISTWLTVEYEDGETARFACELSANGRLSFPDSDLPEDERLGQLLYSTTSSKGGSIKTRGWPRRPDARRR